MMAGYQPNAPPRPVAVPWPRRQRRFRDVSSRCQEAVRPIDDVIFEAADPDDPRHAFLDLELGSV